MMKSILTEIDAEIARLMQAKALLTHLLQLAAQSGCNSLILLEALGKSAKT